MATIEKRGNSYRITVSAGYDINGKQIRRNKTWTPESGMTERQIQKELNNQAVLFENQVKHNLTHDGNIRLVDFTKIFLRDHAKPNLKKKTVFGYEKTLNVINQALGHIKLKDLNPGHIAAFYANLQEAGMRQQVAAHPKIDFAELIKERNTSMAELARITGLSVWTFKQLKRGENIFTCNALTIADALGIPYDDLFRTETDMTPLKPGTIHDYHRVLSSVLSRAVKWRYISENPALGADLPSIAHRQAAYLDEPDAWRLLELLRAEPIKWRTVISFDLLSGLRRAEILGLRWRDVDFDNQMIHVRQTWNYVPTQGCYVDTPKTPSSERSLKITKTALLLLQEYKRWQDKQKEALGDAWMGTDDRVFTSDDGKPMFPDSVTQWFTKFVKRTGLPKVTVHSLRHTYASLQIYDGVSLVALAHGLGHSQPSTSGNIYGHIIADAAAKAANTFDRFGPVVLQNYVEEDNVNETTEN